jgi:tRNA(Ile)-lysidine synthase
VEKISESRLMVERPRLTPAIANARRAVRELLVQSVAKGETVLLACSGGGDSIALLAACSFEAPKLGIKLAAIVIDHGLQPGSNQVAQDAIATAQSLGIELVKLAQVEVTLKGEGMEAAARQARYQAIEDYAKEISAVATLLGHNLEDQAETVLLGLARGSGLSAISGMPMVSEDKKYLRPFLELGRDELRQSCQDLGLSYWDDPHNQDPQFLRVRARGLLAELEEQLGPGFVSGLSRTAEIAQEALAELQSQAQALEKRALVASTARQLQYKISELSASPALRKMVLHLIAQKAGAKNISRSQILGVDELVTNWHGQKSVVLSGITVERVKDHLLFKSNKSPGPGAC